MKNNILKQWDYNKLTIALTAFMIIQPLLDLNFFFIGDSPEILGLAIPSLIRIIGVGSFFIYSIYWEYTTNKVYFKSLVKKIILYLIICAIYFGLHSYIAMNYHPIGNIYQYSITSEFIYLVKLTIPLLLILMFNRYSVYRNIKWIIGSWIILIAGQIVLSNIFEFSLSSYTNQPIVGNIFSWFNGAYDKYSFLQLASKGFFRYANEVGAVMAMILPIVCYYAYKDKSIKFAIGLILLEAAMLMIGTRVGLYSFIILNLLTFLIYIVYDVIISRKNKLSIQSLGLLILTCVFFFIVYPMSPSQDRTSSTQNSINISDSEITDTPSVTDNNSTETLNEDALKYSINDVVVPFDENLDFDEIVNYILESLESKRIKKELVTKFYDFKYDPIFWYETLQLPNSITIDNRIMEKSILNRVKSINNNSLELLTGMGNSRMNQMYPLEMDLVSHYYTIGVLGILIFMPQYLVVFIVCLYLALSFKIFKVKGELVVLILSVGFTTVVAINSGNMLDSLFSPLILALLISQILNFVKE